MKNLWLLVLCSCVVNESTTSDKPILKDINMKVGEVKIVDLPSQPVRFKFLNRNSEYLLLSYHLGNIFSTNGADCRPREKEEDRRTVRFRISDYLDGPERSSIVNDQGQEGEGEEKEKEKEKERAPTALELIRCPVKPEDGNDLLIETIANPEDNKKPPLQAKIEDSREGADFCVIFTEDTGLNIDEVTGHIRTFMTRFKQLVYHDDFPEKNDLVFKPFFVFTSFNNWGENYEKHLSLFSEDRTKAKKIPMIFTRSNIGEFSSELSFNEEGKRVFFHGLLHSLQEAIAYYYKPESDFFYIKESLNHLIAGAMGYFDLIFEPQVLKFLQQRHQNGLPFLELNQPNNTLSMGGTMSLLYYLAIQKGGFNYYNGRLQDSGGLRFLANLVRSNQYGVQNIRDRFGTEYWTWSETIGHYLATMFLDNMQDLNFEVDSSHRLPEIYEDILDITGVRDSFGFRFNNFAELKGSMSEIPELDIDEFDLHHYQTRPFRINIEKKEQEIKIGAKSAVGNPYEVRSSVALVRLR